LIRLVESDVFSSKEAQFRQKKNFQVFPRNTFRTILAEIC